jgi:hypothetical protein
MRLALAVLRAPQRFSGVGRVSGFTIAALHQTKEVIPDRVRPTGRGSPDHFVSGETLDDCQAGIQGFETLEILMNVVTAPVISPVEYCFFISD